MNPEELRALVDELRPLVGARCQRVDVIDDGELAIELRVPGRTLRLLIVTRPPTPRAHLVPERPTKRQVPGAFQGLLRKRLEGRPLTGLASEAHTLLVDVAGTRLSARLGAGRQAFELTDLPPTDVPRATAAVPDSFPTSDALALRYGLRAEGEVVERTRRGLVSSIDSRAKRVRRLLSRLDGDEAGLRRHQDARRVAELLKSVMHLRPSTKSGQVAVTDWSSGEAVELSVPVDPSVDVRGAVERLFSKAKRAERGLPQIAARRAEAEAELAILAEARVLVLAATADEVLERARAADHAGEPTAPDHAGGVTSRRADGAGAAGHTARMTYGDKGLPTTSSGGPAPSGRREGARGPERTTKDPLDQYSRRFTALGGLEIRVGKGARENDRLTLSGARGHDLWLHARGTPGAHVLLRLSKGQAPPTEALLDAAHLAAHYSSARGEGKVEVTYTEARNVRKAKGAPAGQVTVASERTMLLRVEPARLVRLLEQQPGGAGNAGGSPR
jgi:predicted ribosome quality control (RQC) complex YloA/Tae2 family protein